MNTSNQKKKKKKKQKKTACTLDGGQMRTMQFLSRKQQAKQPEVVFVDKGQKWS